MGDKGKKEKILCKSYPPSELSTPNSALLFLS